MKSLKSTPLVNNKSILGGEREFAKLSPQDKAIELKAYNRIDKEADKILNDYFSKKGKVVNTDDFRKYFVKDGYNGANAAAVQEPASELGKRAYLDMIYKMDNIACYSGGKTSHTKKHDSGKGLRHSALLITRQMRVIVKRIVVANK